MDRSARVRQRALAVFLPLAAVLYISAEALDPKGTDQLATDLATGLKLLAIAARHPTQLYAAGALSLLGGIGAFCGAIVNVLVGVNLAAAATARTSPDAAARFLVTTFDSGAAQLFTYAYFATEYVAPILMGIALWRSRRVPLWLAALFTVGFEAAEAQSAKGPIVIAFILPWAIAMILLAVRIWQAAGQPAADPEPRPAAEPVAA